MIKIKKKSLFCEVDCSPCDHHIQHPVKHRVGLHPESYNSICPELSCRLLEFLDELLPDVPGELAKPLDLAAHEALEAAADVAEGVPALYLAGHDQALVLLGHSPTRGVGGVHLHCVT